ncbi:MAG: hypothetical protein K2P14_05190 [Anaeroplasmataceae bacterium]|nr:hypothetical protein [Anaeroplasmataceae bacterium]
MENSYSYFILSIVANMCQLMDFQMNMAQLSNDDLMKELLNQDKILDNQNKILEEQTNIYLKKIIEQNEQIIKLLEK